MNETEYKRELELIKKQNWIEYDLYSIIANVMRERENMKHLSLRDVSKRRRVKNRKNTKGQEWSFYGLSGFPDFAILPEEYERQNPKKILGVVEIKNVEEKLDEIEENTQLMGHLLWFSKVIYTNGLEWKYYKYIAPNNSDIQQVINKLQQEVYELKSCDSYKWYAHEKNIELLEAVKNIKSIWPDGSSVLNPYKDWDKFINNLNKLKWN